MVLLAERRRVVIAELIVVNALVVGAGSGMAIEACGGRVASLVAGRGLAVATLVAVENSSAVAGLADEGCLVSCA